jgi:transcriptional regulator of arginine metabolism
MRARGGTGTRKGDAGARTGAAGARRGQRREQPRAQPRSVRLTAIRRIVAETAVDSQERLTELLRAEGFAVTQATLSRDLKRLGIGKAPSPDGGYTYILPDGEVKPGSDATYVQDFTRGFLSIEFSGSLGVMRTLPGHASSVASALDNLRIREVLGTIAGDDTILLVPRSGISPARLTRAIQGRIPGFTGEQE